MHRTAIVIAAVTLTFSGATLAGDDAAKSGPGDPAQAETQHQSEVLDDSSDPAVAQPNFDELDRNQDGKLDEDELSAYGSTAAGGGEDMMDRLDQDGDGAVSQEELQKGSSSAQQGDGATGAGSSGGATQ